ncbi:MAG TPA: tetratricopeptide repeat protein [Vicinamibacterales bacterium]|jgi:tetratricopeptide (TPR) repeat protein
MRLLAAFACAITISTAVFAQAAAGRAGWDAIREGRNEDAAAVFADAIRAEPRNPSLYLGAGLAAQLLGDTAKARDWVEQALKLAPNFTPASLLLGDLLYRQSDLQGAIAVYEAALKYAPDDKTLLARLAQLRDEPSPEKGFFQSRSAHFTVLFEGPADDELARRAVDVLETAYWRVGTALYTFPDHVITVVLYTEEQFRDTTRSPSWAAAAYDGRIRIPMRGALERAPGELERVLTHELAHAMIRAIAPRGVPTWLNEGLAVTFEPDGSEWATTMLSKTDTRIPLDELGGSFDNLSPNQARVAYAESADAARRLLDEIGGAGVVALLQDIARGVPIAKAFQRRMLTPYSAFAASLR